MATERKLQKQINWKAIIRVQGFLLMVLSVFLLAPLGVAIYYQEDIEAFAISAGVSLAMGILAMYLCRNHRGIKLGKREGFLLTATVWIVLSLFGMIPFMLGKPQLGITDAFFESMSGFTTTGASTISDYNLLSHAMHLWRCMMQWMGGMGIIIFTVALLPMLNTSGGLQMFNAETTGFIHDKIAPRVSQTAKRLWIMYITLTSIAFLLLWLGPMNLFESVCHAMSTMSTGGFSTSPDGLSHWDSRYVYSIVTVFMWVGGINFVVLYRLSCGQLRQAWSNEVLRAYIYTILAIAAIIAVAGIINHTCSNPIDYLLHPLFNTISTISSTGYEIGNIDSWSGIVFPLILIMMLVGGCAGSTSGGAKIDRFVYLFKNCHNEMRRAVHPNRYYPLGINGNPVGNDALPKVTAFIIIYLLLIIVGGLILSISGTDDTHAFVSTLSCVSNTASSSESVAQSLTTVTDVGKWVLAMLMLVGRLEIFTVLVLLTPTFWKRS